MIRSEEMSLVRIIERNESARDIMTELGEAGLLHLRDLNGDAPVYKRAFATDVKRCDEMARRVMYLTAQVKAKGLAIAPPRRSPSPTSPATGPFSRSLVPPLDEVAPAPRTRRQSA